MSILFHGEKQLYIRMKRQYDGEIVPVDQLFIKAFQRVKERFLNFLVVTILGWGLGIVIAVAFGLGIGIVLVVWGLVKVPAVVTVVAVLTSVLFFAILIYLTSWVQLTMIESLIQKKRVGPFETYKKVKQYVKDYVVFAVLLMLFFLGLFPFTVVSLFIVGLLWTLWNSFSTFVFLEKRKKGLENLWISREMVNQKFWPIAGLVFVVAVIVVVVSGLFVSTRNGFVSPLVSQLILAPFITSFYYEMYRTVKAPQEGKRPGVWVGLSVVGFVLLVFIVIVSFQELSKAIPEFMKKNPPEKNPFYKELLYPSPDKII